MLLRLIRELLSRQSAESWHAAPAAADAHRHYELARSHEGKGDLGAAEGEYQAAIALDPKSGILHYNLALLQFQVGDLSSAEAGFRRAFEINPDDQMAYASLLCICDFSMALTREEILERHVNWAARFADPLGKVPATYATHRAPHRRLRVGYVSADFRRHAVGRFIEPVLRLHDASQFDVHCYSNATDEDDMTRHLRTLVPAWKDIHGVGDLATAAMIRQDSIDILVDLSGHSAGNRLLVFAHKPAPIQMTWLGYLNTTGMRAMDYRITDEVADPVGNDGWYRERLLRLSRPQWCYVPDAGPITAPVGPIRRRPEGARLTMACMTRFMKISDAALGLWVRILRAAPAACLRIIDVPTHARGEAMMRFFRDSGVGDQVEVFPTLQGERYWSMFSEIDVALDPFPYTGATTTFDCLWMGVPVVTLAGECGAARSASSILSALGLDEFIAASGDEYVAIAGAISTDAPRLAKLRADLRQKMQSSVLCDGAGLVGELEAGFRQAWMAWCNGRHADSLSKPHRALPHHE